MAMPLKPIKMIAARIVGRAGNARQWRACLPER
jgi:hypothetical protein